MRPDQCTLVPVAPGEITSQAGWTAGPESARLPAIVDDLKSCGVRVSLFVDSAPAAVRLAAAMGADRVELYTEPYARAFEQGDAAAAGRLRPIRRRPSWPISSALASTPATTSISTT